MARSPIPPLLAAFLASLAEERGEETPTGECPCPVCSSCRKARPGGVNLVKLANRMDALRHVVKYNRVVADALERDLARFEAMSLADAAEAFADDVWEALKDGLSASSMQASKEFYWVESGQVPLEKLIQALEEAEAASRQHSTH